jgi:hypothetical protein
LNLFPLICGRFQEAKVAALSSVLLVKGTNFLTTGSKLEGVEALANVSEVASSAKQSPPDGKERKMGASSLIKFRTVSKGVSQGLVPCG